MNAADALLTLAGLGFLGYGVQPTEAAEWGYDLQRALGEASGGIWWTSVFPGLAIVLLVTGLTLVGREPQRPAQPGAPPPPAAARSTPPRCEPTRRPSMSLSDGPLPQPSASDPVLSVRDLKVWYGTARGAVRAVDGVTFDLRRGETLGLVGESGCGKSTLGRGVLGLLPDAAKTTGQVLFQGNDLVTMSRRRLRALRGPDLGLIFQEPMTRLNPLMRISDHFLETLRRAPPGAVQGADAPAGDRRARRDGDPAHAIHATTRTSSPAACGSAS